jgi:alpha-tubulin suppressor-like RCC1 family protein
LPADLYFTQITTGIDTDGSHACAIGTNGSAYCWGNGANGRLGRGNTTSSDFPRTVFNISGTVKQISAGMRHTCAIVGSAGNSTSDMVYCWGSHLDGQLGIGGSSTQQTNPTVIYTGGGTQLAGKTILSVSSGGEHTCAIASDNTAHCWGKNDDGRLGLGYINAKQTVPNPVQTTGVLSGKTLTDIQAGSYNTCAVDSTGQVYCWGRDDYGQLGDGAANNGTNVSSPVLVDQTIIGAVQQISLGSSYVCAVNTNAEA